MLTTGHNDVIALWKTCIIISSYEENIRAIKISCCFDNFYVAYMDIKSRYHTINLCIEIQLKENQMERPIET